MKRIFVSALILAALLAVTTGTAFAGSALELVQVRNDEGGVRFIFRVTGEFSQDELNSGFVQVEGGDDFPLYCAQKDATTVVCQTSKRPGHTVLSLVLAAQGSGRMCLKHKVPFSIATQFMMIVFLLPRHLGSHRVNIARIMPLRKAMV